MLVFADRENGRGLQPGEAGFFCPGVSDVGICFSGFLQLLVILGAQASFVLDYYINCPP